MDGYRAFANFEVKLDNSDTVLVIGENGSGKTSFGKILSILQSVARGENRSKVLFPLATSNSFFYMEPSILVEIEADIEGLQYKYQLELELPDGFREYRVKSELLSSTRGIIFERESANVTLYKSTEFKESGRFSLDWHKFALPLVQGGSESTELVKFRNWLARTIVISPETALFDPEVKQPTLEPDFEASNVGDWFAGLLQSSPRSYNTLVNFLEQGMLRGFDQIRVESSGLPELMFRFRDDKILTEVPFRNLSKGEQVSFLAGLVYASMKDSTSGFCFWDEPDSHVSIGKLHTMMQMFRGRPSGTSQLVMTSHNAELIRTFDPAETLAFSRPGYARPVAVRKAVDLPGTLNLLERSILGELGTNE